ncbi:hypothetical protein jhhlp_000602 [Lomentospora prolificans]|uniref:Transcription factor spt8 beta-propeller domain-containing protein n=1 Tax=Lomentospora prolificans TaxID=41688 RepID=A0A2N3NJ05_9PEZI|nr:hypothetical protein jhhlp_000602 [Lomentospora prolificans]
MDDDDRGTSENDQDEVMEDVDDADADNDQENDQEGDGDGDDDDNDDNDNDNDNDNEGEEDEEDAEDDEDNADQTETQPVGDGADGDVVAEGPEIKVEDADEKPAEPDANGVDDTAPGDAPSRSKSATPGPARWKPEVRPEVYSAKVYDIIPTMAAPQATSINAMAITPDLRYWITGGSDGYIRKYSGPETINGKQLLTVAQRHPFVDSVVKAGVLVSYWENEEPPQQPARGPEEHVMSPVYSLAVHSQALWLLSGLESGSINLQSVRHDEGKRIHYLKQHTNAVSVLTLSPDEKSVLSGSWDKQIFDWDLNQGTVTRSFVGSGGQISALERRPARGNPFAATAAHEPLPSDTFSTDDKRGLSNGLFSGGAGVSSANGDTADAVGDVASPAHESLFGGSDAGSLFGETMGGGFGGGGDDDDDEFSHAIGMSLEGDSMNAGNADGEADVTMTGLDSTMGDMGELSTQDAAVSSTIPASTDPASSSAPALTSTASVTQDTAPTSMAPTGTPDASISGTTQTTDAATLADATMQDSAPTQDPTQPAATALPDSTQADGPVASNLVFANDPPPSAAEPGQVSDTTFFSASMDGTIRVWDRRTPDPVARISPQRGVPPWCMGACWSPDGNRIYAGRRNGVVEEYDIHKARHGWAPERSLRFPAGSGAVSAVRAMPNGRHLICASHDILRLYDLEHAAAGAPGKQSSVPFLIVPGPPRAGVIAALWVDPTCRFMLSAAGTRGWEGTSTEVLIGYEIQVPEG